MRMNSDPAGIQGPGFCLAVLVGLVLGLAAPVAKARPSLSDSRKMNWPLRRATL